MPHSKKTTPSEDLLVVKGNQLHVIMLKLIAVYSVIYAVTNLFMGYIQDVFIIVLPIFTVAVAYLLFRKGKRMLSKIWNASSIMLIIGTMCYIDSQETMVLAFFIPIVVGTLIVFQGPERNVGYVLTAITLGVLSVLTYTGFGAAVRPEMTPEKLHVEWMLNIVGASVMTMLEILFIMRISNDIQKQLVEKSEQLGKSNSELMMAVRTREKMLSILSHDLRSPVALLSSSLNLLRPSKIEPTMQEKLVEQLHERTQQTLALVDNLVLWTRSQSNHIEYHPAPLALSDLGKFISNYCNLYVNDKGIQFSIQLPENGSLVCDKEMIYTILRNLISNAFKFSNPKGTVTVRAEIDGGACRFSVRDQGKGMTQEMADRLLKGDSFTLPGTQNEKGHGLGMQLVHEFLLKHGSRLEIVTAPDAGTEFSFRLPFNA